MEKNYKNVSILDLWIPLEDQIINLQTRNEKLYYIPTPQILESIRDMFVTGKWAEGEDAATRLGRDGEGEGSDDGDDDGEEEELYGDFEDLETGEKHDATTAESGGV